MSACCFTANLMTCAQLAGPRHHHTINCLASLRALLSWTARLVISQPSHLPLDASQINLARLTTDANAAIDIALPNEWTSIHFDDVSGTGFEMSFDSVYLWPVDATFSAASAESVVPIAVPAQPVIATSGNTVRLLLPQKSFQCHGSQVAPAVFNVLAFTVEI